MTNENLEIKRRFENTSKSKTFQNIVSEFDLGKKTVLDIGCSYGEFLPHFGNGSTGVSIIKEEVNYGIKSKLDVVYGNIEDNNFLLNKKYDVIFANNIFEHLYSPHNFLIRVKKYLNKDGILILGVPVFPKIYSLLKMNKFRGSLAVSHINFFTKDTLKETVKRGGWNISLISSFHFKSAIFNKLIDSISPHSYVVASVNYEFKYDKKRLKEIVGYSK